MKQSLRPKAVAVSSVSLAMYAEPLSDNHSTGCAALLIPKLTLDACYHQVAHHLAGDAGGGGQPPITSRSQASIANNTRTISPLRQASSK